MIRLGKLPSSPNTLSLLMVSSLPTMSSSNRGLYFSTHGKFVVVVRGASKAENL